MPPVAGPDADAGSRWWSRPGSERVWRVVAARLERSGLTPAGRASVSDLDRTEQRAVSDLLGREVTGGRVSIDLGELDDRLRRRAGLGVVEAAQRLAGPLVDRPSARADSAARREAPFAAYQEWVQEHPEADVPWAVAWLDELRRDGVLARDADPVRLLLTAAAVLLDRGAYRPHGPGSGPPVARTELAARVAGDAHALDDDRRLAGVVLRAAAGACDVAPGELSRRDLWERLGVLADTVSSTCLVLGLSDPGGPEAAPEHLTWWRLRRGWWPPAGLDVLVCENPRVLEAVAERVAEGVSAPGGAGGPALAGRAVVCTQGRPALVVVEVLSRLRGAGARLRYHGDFDWPGVAMANDLVRRLGAQPWAMSAQDYLDTPASLDLGGRVVEPVWDPELGAAMRHRGAAVHEEAVLPGLADRFLAPRPADPRESPGARGWAHARYP